jgi:hypothetical protein
LDGSEAWESSPAHGASTATGRNPRLRSRHSFAVLGGVHLPHRLPQVAIAPLQKCSIFVARSEYTRVRVDGSCFVGISFHHRRTTQRHFVYSSLAQAFSSEGDGFAIRGDAVPWNDERVQPRLSEEQALYLLSKVLDAYRDRAGRDPLRVVVHKTSNFTPDENAGIAQALRSVPVIELLTLRPSEFRMLRDGTYPPHRGTYCSVNDDAFLFTSGYMPAYRTYPGPHVPAPIELVAGGGVDTEAAANDVLALTKMNWNSASAFMGLPITLNFAQKVGAVMGEIPPDVEPHPSLRFYM